jgi:5'-nucleotidase (lipoprotein e(P4) family)
MDYTRGTKMKINHLPSALLAALLILTSCGSIKSARHAAAIQYLPAGPAWGALWQQKAAEYKALSFQSYNLARMRLDQLLRDSAKKAPAIITDIDETVLDNSPYFIREAKKGKIYNDSTWIQWTAEMKCDTLPGAYQFLKYAQSRGVTVFYITNRFQQEQMATVKNLQKFNLPNADTTHLFLLKTANSSKETRRQVVLKNYNVLLLLGDNLGDFSSIFDHLTASQREAVTVKNSGRFGNQFIVFPNAMYGKWEDIIYSGGNLSITERNKTLNQ